MKLLRLCEQLDLRLDGRSFSSAPSAGPLIMCYFDARFEDDSFDSL